eukprot:821574-Amorphochlora_amoeboformis.AAC.2
MSNPSGQVIGWMLDYAAHEYLGELVVKLERLYSTFDSPYEGRDTCDKNLLLHCFHNILNHEEEFAKEDPMQIVQMFLQLHAGSKNTVSSPLAHSDRVHFHFQNKTETENIDLMSTV